MKVIKALLLTGAVMSLVSIAPSVRAEDYNPQRSEHPFRYMAYGLHAVGKVGEVFVTRPINWVVSRPKMRNVFGKVSQPRTDDYWGDPDQYQRMSY
jgi:hypothetical protein